MGVAAFVLVVEDDFAVKQTTCRFLIQAGYACGSVGNAHAALTALRAGPVPDVLVLDVRLPDLPGTEVAIRAQDRVPGIPVVFVSAYTVELSEFQTLTGVRWQFLPKPYTADELVTAVGRFVPPSVA
jgi:DNA-binding response OmpR family regulator